MIPNIRLNETNGLVNPDAYHKTVTNTIRQEVPWTDKRLRRIVRFRLLTDPSFPAYDVSYCHGQLKSGEYVRVQLPFSQLPKRGWRKAVVWYAKRDGVYAKQLGLFDTVSTFSG